MSTLSEYLDSRRESLRLLLIRRDNIGDLVCTTPSIIALRRRFPKARIDILVNGYNADVVKGLPELDHLHIYHKSKHHHFRFPWQHHIHMASLFRRIRRERYDVAIGVNGSFNRTVARYAWMTGARHRIGYSRSPSSLRPHPYYTHNVEPFQDPDTHHEVEKCYRLLRPLGIEGEPGPLKLVVHSAYESEVRRELVSHGVSEPPTIFHISSRKPENRWSLENFSKLGRLIASDHPDERFLILWSPGDETDPHHPGDDRRARSLKDALGERAVLYRTGDLLQLIAALAAGRIVVCGDGGAMHIAAALQRPIVAIFGSSKVHCWHPWGTECELLKRGEKADDNSVEEVYEHYRKLLARIGQ